MKNKIVIVVNGGCLSGVWAASKDTEVELIDIDNIKERDNLEEGEVDKMINKAAEGLVVIF